ncbi:armadillo-type protein [Gaertneriomyces semiglobifer]|nr:armadillo-type protein [Gaertneriomyces semiglobifer]
MATTGGLRGHQISFSIPHHDRENVSLWIQNVKTFFSTTAAQAADVSRTFLPATGSSMPGSLFSPVAASTAAVISNVGGFGGPLGIGMDVLNDQNLIALEDVLEGITVHYAVQLTSVLGHFMGEIRIQAAGLLYDLATIFDRRIPDGKKKFDKVSLSFQTDDRGYYSAVQELFHLIGAPLSLMAVALVAGLECFYTCPDWGVRGVCNTALAQIVFENERTFLGEDQLAAIWNLFFSLHSIPLISKVFPDRIVIINALGLLGPLFAPADLALSYRVVDTLLRLRNKTASELRAIKLTVRKIFERLGPSATAETAVVDKGLDAFASGFAMFTNLINPHDEYAYDLLPWALENFTAAILPVQKGSATPAKKFPIADFPPLTEFIKSLANHFRAIPALVRYGACVCLHSALSICPDMVSNNRELYVHIITGALDTDYSSAFLYISMLDAIRINGDEGIKDLLSTLRHQDRLAPGYDALYADPVQVKGQELLLTDVLRVAVKASPPLPPKTLQKMANSLEYLTKGMQLRQLEIIRLWGSRSEKFDTFLMQTLVPYCNSPDEDIQKASISVISALVPSLVDASTGDIAFLWAYLHSLMDFKNKACVLQRLLDLVKLFPVEKLADDARRDLLRALFKLVFHQEPAVRLMVYDIIGGLSEFWTSNGLFGDAISIMFLSIGDHNPQCAKKVIDYIFGLSDKSFPHIATPLGNVKDAQGGPFPLLLRAYDELAYSICMARERTEVGDLIKSITMEDKVDEFWNFFLQDAPDNQLVRPDDYNYARNFVHTPFWISLLLTKLEVLPPSVAEGTPRNVMPTTPAGKRRFICGFILCLLPTCGMPDPVMRNAACISIIRCCFKGHALHSGMMRGLLEFASQQMMAHKQWTFQLSALDILKTVTRLKLPGISPAMLVQYIDLSLDVAYNTPSSIVKMGSLQLIEVFMLVFPHGIAEKLQEVRDVVRALIVDADADVVNYAARLFPLVFRCVPTAQSDDFIGYLHNEIFVILKGGPEASADPMISSLTQEERDHVVRLSVQALGAFNDPAVAYSIMQELLPFLRLRPFSIRCAAVAAILSQMQNLDGPRKAAMMWAVLPLYADPNENIRRVFSRYLRRAPSRLDALVKAVPPHPDDSLVLPSTPWEELLTDNINCTVNVKNLNDILFAVDQLSSTYESDSLPPEDDGFRLPTVSQNLMSRIKDLAKVVAGPVPGNGVSEAMYYLQDLQRSPLLQSASILVMSEFACIHDSTMQDVIDILSHHLNQDVSSESAPLVEACMLGLRNISEFSPAAFKQILAKLISPPAPSEGDLMALFYLCDLIQDICPNKAVELLRKYIPVITSQRHAIKKRVLAVYLTVELAVMSGQDEMARVLDAIQIFLDAADEAELRVKIYGCLGKILGQLGPKHALFRTLLNSAKKDIRSKDPAVRLRTLDIIRTFSKYMSTDEALWFCFLYLADSNREVRRKAKEILVLEGMLDFAIPGLRSQKPGTDVRRSAILESCKLPSIDKRAALLEADDDSDNVVKVPLPNDDPFNVRWYSSERRRKFSTRYGIPEAAFARATVPVPQSITVIIDDKCTMIKTPTPEALAKYQMLLNLDNISILRECVRKYPQIAADLVENILGKIEREIAPRNFEQKDANIVGQQDSDEERDPNGSGVGLNGEDDDVDIEAEIHHIDLLSNLLFAHDGIGDKLPGWLTRLQALIAICNNSARIIRESLYTTLESSFFFFNEYIDIPIVSDEQYEALEAFKAATQEATLEIVKSGKTDKFSQLEMRKNELNDLTDTKSEQLRRLTIMALHGISGYGLCHALSQASPETRLISAFQFLSDMLENEHRGVRIAVVEALVTLSMLQLQGGGKASFIAAMQNIFQSFIVRLNEDAGFLYRRKADIINVMAQLMSYVPDTELRSQLVSTLVRLWKDPDSEVRVTAIKMIQLLGESGLNEVNERFKIIGDTREYRGCCRARLHGLIACFRGR